MHELQIQTAEEAVNVAEEFLSRYHWTKTLEKVEKIEDKWLIIFDVGVVDKQLVHVTLDAQTGKVIGYTKEERSGYRS